MAAILPRARHLVGGLSLGGLGGLALAFVCACGGNYSANEPADDINDACCKVANDDMTKFAGCRPTGRCAKDEPIWMRGYIKCTAVEEERCAGGRCCEYRPMYGSPDSVLHWDDSSGEEQDSEGTKPDTQPDTQPDEPQIAPEVSPAPAEVSALPSEALPSEAMPSEALPSKAAPSKKP